MWKESYRIGINVIDQQHIELFKRADALLDAIKKNADAEKYRRTVAFLKEYVVVHFRDEEAYQEAIHYKDIEAHKKAHRDFTATVLDFEKRLEASNYEIGVVKELAGTLTAWLVYHVADTDQRIATGAHKAGVMEYDFLETFSKSVREVLEKLVGLDGLEDEGYIDSDLHGDVFVKVELKGICPGTLIFGFSRELAFTLVERMTFTAPVAMDEFVISTLAELANIASGNAISARTAEGTRCGFSAPEFLSAKAAGEVLELIPVRTGIVGMDLKYTPAV